MTFGDALSKLKEGYCVKRKGWNGKDQFLALATEVSFTELRNTSEITCFVNHSTMGNRAIVFHGTSGIQIGWLASQADLLSEDWEVINA